MKKRNIIILVICLMVCCAIGVLFFLGVLKFGPQSVSREVVIGVSKNIEVQENEIVFTDKGYVPSELTVNAGTEIIFTNLTPLFMNPYGSIEGGSDSFDANVNIQSNQSWKVTLNTKGTWKYFDHANKGIFGTIIVK